jgi:SAM-dependent methyltransferase
VNLFHRWYCGSTRWRKALHDEYLPGVLRGLALGDDVLEVGPGPGLATDWLRARVARLTSLEIDPRLAGALRRRLAGTNVSVVEGDATAMPFPGASFSAVLSFTMLHHVPARLQDALLREAARVLRPGCVFAGMDSTPSLAWDVYHLFDDRNPVDPATFGGRLEAAGFVSVRVRASEKGFSWRARSQG